MKIKTFPISRLLAIALVASGVSAKAQLTISPTFDSSITGLPYAALVEAGINADIVSLENNITTNVPTNLTIEFQNSSSGLGGAETIAADLAYSTYLTALENNPNKSANDLTALSNMPAGPGTGINGNATLVFLTAANLAAIGQTSASASLVALNGGFDGIVSLNLSIMNLTRPDANPSDYDLQSVAANEINKVLGIGGFGSELGSGRSDVGPLDLFRYSAPGVLSFSTNPSATAYFSINNGLTNLVNFNQAGGGSSYGDWVVNTPPQVQDAFGTPGGQANLGANELTALDVVGYNLTALGMADDGLTASAPDVCATSLLLSMAITGLAGLRRKFSA